MCKCANYQVRKKEAGLNATENLEKMSQFLFKMSRECVGDRQERRMWSWLTHNWATERESRKAQSQDTQEEKKKRASQMVLVVKKVKVKSSVMSDSLQACGI